MKRPTRMDAVLLVATAFYVACTGASLWISRADLRVRAAAARTVAVGRQAVAQAQASDDEATEVARQDFAAEQRAVDRALQLNRVQSEMVPAFRTVNAVARRGLQRRFDAALAATRAKLAECAALDRTSRAALSSEAAVAVGSAQARQLALAAAATGAVPGWHRWVTSLAPAGFVPYLACFVWRFAVVRRDRQRRSDGRCVGCGYDLRGNVSGTCPECGRAGTPMSV